MASIGIMGGTFNPIHIGHTEIAKAAYEQYHLDEIWFMPNHIPAYKSEDQIVSSENRLEMIRLAIKDIPYCKASDFELKREGNTYTIDTLKLLNKQYPEHSFYFIMGADSLYSFDKWRSYKEIPSYAKLLVAPRNEKSIEDIICKLDEFNQYFGKDCFSLIRCREIPCSSSEIRESITRKPMSEIDNFADKRTTLQCNTEYNFYLEEAVYDYIQSHNLYM